MANGGNARRLKTQTKAVQLSLAGILRLYGNNGLRLWEILKGITTPAEFRLVATQLTAIQSTLKQVEANTKALEAAGKQIGG
jgi:hypothetical protein